MQHLLRVEHCTQEESSGCLAACTQMALQYIGIQESQRRLNHLLGLTDIGIPASHIQRITQLGVEVRYATGDEQSLRNLIDQELPPILFLLTGDLPYWDVNIRHAVILVGYDDAHVFFNDPAFPAAPKQVNWGDFLLAWSEFDYRYAVISR